MQKSRLHLLTILLGLTAGCASAQMHCESPHQPPGDSHGQYDALMRAARAKQRNPWFLAFDDCGTDSARLLLEHGHSPNETDASGMTLLVAAMKLHREDLFDLLLGSGADPNLPAEPGATPLDEAVRDRDVTGARKLLRAGALPILDPADTVFLLSNSPAAARSFMFEYLEAYGHITERMVLAAAFARENVLPDLVASNYPVQIEVSYWKSGARLPMAPHVARQLEKTPDRKADVERLFLRGDLSSAIQVQVTGM